MQSRSQAAWYSKQLLQWLAGGALLAMFAFGPLDDASRQQPGSPSLLQQIDPLVIGVFGRYDTLLSPIPTYLFMGLMGATVGLFCYSLRRALTERKAQHRPTNVQP